MWSRIGWDRTRKVPTSTYRNSVEFEIWFWEQDQYQFLLFTPIHIFFLYTTTINTPIHWFTTTLQYESTWLFKSNFTIDKTLGRVVLQALLVAREEIGKEEAVAPKPNTRLNIEVNKPPIFNRDISKFLRFIIACKLYIRMRIRNMSVEE